MVFGFCPELGVAPTGAVVAVAMSQTVMCVLWGGGC